VCDVCVLEKCRCSTEVAPAATLGVAGWNWLLTGILRWRKSLKYWIEGCKQPEGGEEVPHHSKLNCRVQKLVRNRGTKKSWKNNFYKQTAGFKTSSR
jgi:hypothetical protein